MMKSNQQAPGRRTDLELVGLVILIVAIVLSGAIDAAGPTKPSHPVTLQSRILPEPSDRIEALQVLSGIPGTGYRHVLVRLNSVPDATERAAFAAAGLVLLQPASGNLWFAKASGGLDQDGPVLRMVDAAWEIQPGDRLSIALRDGVPPRASVDP